MRKRVTVAVIRDGKVLLVRDKGVVSFSLPGGAIENGKVIVPSARQIYLAEYKGKCSIDGTTVARKPSQDLPHTSFSKYPLDLFLIINPPRTELSQPAMCRIAGIRNDMRINIDSISVKMLDHILQDNTWYPLIKSL